ncbi:hypothetical protein [Streptomyces sp. NPDC057302]|uniref:hypothetical protein n=1 Tax=Streptomyces sp. NPDC057302 TaxID=3346094 RepID=UPI00362E6D73
MSSFYNANREGYTYKPHGRCRACNTELVDAEGHCRTAFRTTRVVHAYCKPCHQEAVFCGCPHPEGCDCRWCE